MGTVKKVKKAQSGGKTKSGYVSPFGKKTADSTNYYNDKVDDMTSAILNLRTRGVSEKDTKGYQRERAQAIEDRARQGRKGLPGFDKNGFPIKKQKTGGKTKMKTGGTVKKTMSKSSAKKQKC